MNNKEKIELGFSMVTRCGLCVLPTPATVKGFWEPDEATAKRLGQPKGKTRLMFWGLCDYHHAQPDFLTKLETHIIKLHTVQ
jgi:hypothetical protein